MLGALLPHCRALGLERALVVCDESNPASRRVILANGGAYESTVISDGERIERYWIAT